VTVGYNRAIAIIYIIFSLFCIVIVTKLDNFAAIIIVYSSVNIIVFIASYSALAVISLIDPLWCFSPPYNSPVCHNAWTLSRLQYRAYTKHSVTRPISKKKEWSIYFASGVSHECCYTIMRASLGDRIKRCALRPSLLIILSYCTHIVSVANAIWQLEYTLKVGWLRLVR